MTLEMSARDDLVRILETTELGAKIQARGEPQYAIFFWPEPGDIGRLELTVYDLVVRNWKGKWRQDERTIQRQVRTLLWETFRPDPMAELGDRPASTIDKFLERISVEEKDFLFLIEVENLRLVESPLSIDDVRVGYTFDLVPAEMARRVNAKAHRASGVWFEIRVSAPHEKLALSTAFGRAEEALDILATLDQRSRDRRGTIERVCIGSFYLQPDRSETGDAGYHNPLAWRDYTIGKSFVEGDPSPRYKAPVFPWRELPEGCELALALREAYRRFGHARRLADDPEVAIPLAMSALETLLVAEQSKGIPATARLIQASIMTDRPTLWPLELFEWFERRNSIVHEWERGPIRWDANASSRAFWSLYGVLDLVADAGIRGKHRTRESLHKALKDAGREAEAREVVNKRIADLAGEMDHALTDQHRGMLAGTIEIWKKVQKHL